MYRLQSKYVTMYVCNVPVQMIAFPLPRLYPYWLVIHIYI